MNNQNVQEALACKFKTINREYFNPNCVLPYGLAIDHLSQAMDDFLDFLGFINQQLHTKGMPRLESFLMPANFSSIVGEFMNISIRFSTRLKVLRSRVQDTLAVGKDTILKLSG